MFPKTLNHIKHKSKKAVLAFIFFGLLISIGCGKRKPPLPPVEKVAQRVEISGFQRGDKIFLSWILGNRNASDASVLNISRADVYRLTESLSGSSTISEDEFASRSTLIATLPITEDDFGRRQMHFIDTLNFAGQPARVRYAIRFVNASGQKAGFSNFLLFEPTARVASPPGDVALAVSQTAIEIRWKPPIRNIDGSTPPNTLGFNVYRKEENGAEKLLNASPVTSDTFADRTFEFEKNYTYFLRSVSLGSNGAPIESIDSAEARISPKDTFPPAAPSAITIAAAPTSISIFFASNIENDVVGYKVFRSTDPNLPNSNWELLTDPLLTTNTFQDANVESGKTYFYYLVAVDKFGNASEQSEVVSETVP